MTETPARAAPFASLLGICKSFAATCAVDDVSIDIYEGQVLALLGENGAGKSTLMKLLYGVHEPDRGKIIVDGPGENPISSPLDAMRLGIGMVFQNFALIPALSVRENLLLAWPDTPVVIKKIKPQNDPVLKKLYEIAPQIDPFQKVGSLSVGEQQLVELCKILNLSTRLVILDEPTSVLTPAEAERLHGFVRSLAENGVGVVFITHKFSDVKACADRIAIMRRGQLIEDVEAQSIDHDGLVRAVMGTDATSRADPPGPPKSDQPRLQIRGLSAHSRNEVLEDINLNIASGEIFAIAGVSGNGQSLLAEVVAGVHQLDDGDVLLDGTSIARHASAQIMKPHVAYIPEAPRINGCVEDLDLGLNLALRDLSTVGTKPLANVRAELEKFDVRPPDPAKKAGDLSGGNLQKLVIARELADYGKAVLAVYPTMGLDIEATKAVYARIFSMAAAGAAVLWISEELDDMLESAHTIAVMRSGHIVEQFKNSHHLTRQKIGALMTGAHDA